MKNVLLIILLILLGACCPVENGNEKDIRERNELFKWIHQNEKPIVCRLNASGINGYRKEYTLQSATNEFYVSGYIPITLPDTIHVSKVPWFGNREEWKINNKELL